MIGGVFGEDEKIVEVDDYEAVEDVGKDTVHGALECSRSAGEAEMHDEEIERTVMSTERSLPLVTGSDTNEFICPTKVDFVNTLDSRRRSRRIGISGRGYRSFLVIALRPRQSTHRRKDPSFFLTKRTGRRMLTAKVG
jgi:hypothetical protein